MEVLAEIKGDPDLTHVPVVVLTGPEAEEDIIQSYKHHSNACLTKPVDPADFISLIRSFEEFFMTKVQLPPDPEYHGP